MNAELRHTVYTGGPTETLALGRRLGQVISTPLVIAIVGPLGAGKTQFTKGVALGAGLDDDSAVTSPTFTLVQEYPCRIPMLHLDFYRLASKAELTGIGFEEMLSSPSIILIEWADRIASALPEDYLLVALHPTGESSRRIDLTPHGPLASACLDALLASAG